MSKKLIIILSVLFIVVIGVFYFINKEKASRLTATVPSLGIPDPIGGGFEVENAIDKNDFNFPSSLPLLTSASAGPVPRDEAKKIASRFGFDEEPSVANDVNNGTTYVWSSPDSALVVYTKTRKILYALNAPNNYINKNLSNEELVGIASNFLSKNLLLDEASFSYFAFLKETENENSAEGLRTTTKEDATVYIAHFSPLKADYKIISLDPQSSPAAVWLSTDGTIIKAEITRFSTLSFGQDKYSLKNYQEFSQSLTRAVVISLDEGFISIVDLPKGSLKKVVVESVELAYLADTALPGKFQPIFLIKGAASVEGFTRQLPVLLYLSALKS